jgi:RNA polymerase subunit RPABC4/transcription elongation factor Spt4
MKKIIIALLALILIPAAFAGEVVPEHEYCRFCQGTVCEEQWFDLSQITDCDGAPVTREAFCSTFLKYGITCDCTNCLPGQCGNEVPEFSTITAIVGLLGAAGVVFVMRK